MKAKVLGVIPARGGSKRFPRKNIANLNGKPLIEYSINAAKNSNLLTDYIFSTDDKEIRNIANDVGGYAPFLRPAELSGDEVRNSSTMIHALNYMEELKGFEYDYVVLLQPTSPLRRGEHIDEAIDSIINLDVDTLASVKGPYKKRDINLKKIVNNQLENLIDKNEEYFIYNAAIYIAKRDWLLKEMRFTSENEVPYIMDEASSIDIDEEIDLFIAEAALKYRVKYNETI